MAVQHGKADQIGLAFSAFQAARPDLFKYCLSRRYGCRQCRQDKLRHAHVQKRLTLESHAAMLGSKLDACLAC